MASPDDDWAPDMAFAAMNNWSFCICGGAAADGVIFWCRGVHLPGLDDLSRCFLQNGHGRTRPFLLSTSWAHRPLWGTINIITTILNMRAPGMTLGKYDRSRDLAHHRLSPLCW